MSYIINNSRGQLVASVPDGTINSSATSLKLVGRSVSDYGKSEGENYVFLLENFANSTEPVNAILGQLWYNSDEDVLSAYNTSNAWVALASQAYVQEQKISPAFTGVPTAPTALAGTSTIQIATTEFVTSSPVFTGTPTAPTASAGTNTTQIATTAFVQGEKVSPTFTGVPLAPTAGNGTANTQIATTAFVINALTSGSNILGTMSYQNANSVTITGGTITSITDLAIADGGTGASTAANARTNLGLGTISTQDASNVSVTGGNIAGITDLAIADGGTGASTAADARTNLDVPSTTGIGATGTWSIDIAGTAVSALSAGSVTTTISANATGTTQSAGTNNTKIATTAFVQTALQSMYPVGSVYINASVSTNPSTLLGFGTWVAFAAGRVLIGDGGGFSAGSTGGSADAIVVEHTHTISDPGHTHIAITRSVEDGVPGTFSYMTSVAGINSGTDTTITSSITASETGIAINSAGSSGTNANLQPYIVVYMWRRTA